ncbi:MAG: DivIVA domain-containing protein [Proteobacteria bacterium]|nr:DivIVA domain-containing protein [Pseudomonadota bacterium]MBU1612136.1 DivIVA domain-containing protein [Pseudomonadota bacterium]
MSLSKIDLLNKKFSRKLFGYDRSEVDQILQEMAEVLGADADEKRELKQRAKQLERQMVEYRERDEALRDTLMSTQKMVDELKMAAGREADQILDEAHSKAEATLRQAHIRLAQVHEEIETLKRHRNQFRVQIRSLVRTHLELIEAEDPDSERKEELESKLTFLKKAE